MIDDHFANEFESPKKEGEKPFVGMLRPDDDAMEEVQEKRLNLTIQYHGDLAGASLLAFASGK